MSRSQRSTFSTFMDGASDAGVAADATEVRKAALFLHALTPTDRDWLIGRLPPTQRARLLALLGELQTLGIPADRRFLEEVIGLPFPAALGQTAQIRSRQAFSASLPATQEERCRMIERADPLQLAAILRDEPAGLIARVFQLRNWSWKRVVLDHLTVPKKRQVEEYCTVLAALPVTDLEADTMAPASLGYALAASLSQRLWQLQFAQLPDARQGNPVLCPNKHPSQLQRWISWLKRVIRGGGKS